VQASKSLPTDGMAIVRFTALISATLATVVLMTGLMLYATGKWPTGDGFALVSGIILLLLVTIPGSLLLYSAARKLLSAEVGSPEVTKYARRVVMICGVQFLLILMATLRGLHAAGHLG
jgi:Zn-dependent membrane protease YugP